MGQAKTPESDPGSLRRPESKAWGAGKRPPSLTPKRWRDKAAKISCTRDRPKRAFSEEFAKKTEGKFPPQIFGNWGYFHMAQRTSPKCPKANRR